MLGMNYTFRFQEKEHCVFEKKVMVKKSLLEINKNTLHGRTGWWWLGWGEVEGYNLNSHCRYFAYRK